MPRALTFKKILKRRSVKRASFESGGDDCPHLTEKHPRMGDLSEMLARSGCTTTPYVRGKIPQNRWGFILGKMKDFQEVNMTVLKSCID